MSESMGSGLTEFELIDLLRRGAPGSSRLQTGIGDDAAITVPGGAIAVTVDAVVEGVHFRPDSASPEQIAQKAVATALSDLAAMAAEPGEIYVSAGLAAGSGDRFLERLAGGLLESAERYGVALAGGDVVSSPVLFLSVTAVGHAASASDFVSRSGAAPGDLIAVTGELGGARAGLWLLDREDSGDRGGAVVPGLDESTCRELVDRQLAPEPLLEAGRALGRAGAAAMIDVSDGLVADLGHLAGASGVSISIDVASLPVASGVEQIAEAAGWENYDPVLGGGEDYELALAIPEAYLERCQVEAEGAGTRLTVIGDTCPGEPGVEVTRAGQALPRVSGHDHLS